MTLTYQTLPGHFEQSRVTCGKRFSIKNNTAERRTPQGDSVLVRVSLQM